MYVQVEPQTLVAFWQCERDDSSRVDIIFAVWDQDFFFKSELLNGDTVIPVISCDFKI